VVGAYFKVPVNIKIAVINKAAAINPIINIWASSLNLLILFRLPGVGLVLVK